MPSLRALDGHLIRYIDPKRHQGLPDDATVQEADGVMFMCPLCDSHYVLVWFAGRAIPVELEPKPRWTASGQGLDTLTLHPSVSLDTESARQHGTCRWHGWVKDGVAA